MIRNDIKNEIQECINNNRGYKYLDNNTFVFEFGDGKFVDEDGDSYFYHIEYHLDTNKWIFQKWYEDEICDAEFHVDEEKYIIRFVVRRNQVIRKTNRTQARQKYKLKNDLAGGLLL